MFMDVTQEQIDHVHPGVEGFNPTINMQVIRDEEDRDHAMGFILALTMACGGCGIDFWWPGIKTGQSFNHPGLTPDGMTVTLPLRPANTLRMDADQIPDIEFTDEKLEDRKALIIRAIQHPNAFTVQLPTEDRNQWRARAVIKAMEGA